MTRNSVDFRGAASRPGEKGQYARVDLHAGLVCVPLPSFFSAEQQRHVLDIAGIDCLIGASADGFACVENEIYRRAVVQPAELHPGTCKITFTSGTTGQPKGVCLDLDTQLAVARSLVAASASRNVERHLCILPLATLLENIAGVYAPLLAGARLELMPMAQIGLSGASGFDLMRFLQAMQAAQPNSLILLPQLLLALVSVMQMAKSQEQLIRDNFSIIEINQQLRQTLGNHLIVMLTDDNRSEALAPLRQSFQQTLERGIAEGVDVVLVDTAGRLHTSTGLMDQLGKVKRVVEKKTDVDEVLLVLDATVGQNGLTQARIFREVVDITGVVLTKLDGTAKGGIVFQVQEELGVPVKLVGLGEGADDLAPFEVEGFVDALLGEK